MDNRTVVKAPEYGEPILTEDEAHDAFLEFQSREWARYQDLGIKWSDAVASELLYRFHASETYLGPLTAKAFAGWCARELKIQLKSPDGQLGGTVPFRMNPMQYRWAEITLDETHLKGKMVRQVILKARQFGFSTAIQALGFFLSSTHSDFNVTTIAHKDDATSNLHEMSKRFLRNLRHKPRTEKSAAKILRWAWPHDSRISLETAKNKEAGRSLTNRFLHMSEIAFWDFAPVTRLGLVQTVADVHGTFIFEESTGNGVGGTFHDQYWRGKKGASNYRSLFFGWWENPLYACILKPSHAQEIMNGLDAEEKVGYEKWGWTAGQIAWRRATIDDKCEGSIMKFHQEYPSYDREAFLVSGLPVFDQTQIQYRMAYLDGDEEAGLPPVSPIFQGILTVKA